METDKFKQSCCNYVTPEDYNNNHKILDEISPKYHEHFLGYLKHGADIATASNALAVATPHINRTFPKHIFSPSDTLIPEYNSLKTAYNSNVEFMN